MIKTILFLIAATFMIAPASVSCRADIPQASGPQPADMAASGATDPFASPGAYVVPFKFNVVDHPFITVEVSVNGSKPHPFIIDTACDCSLAVFDWAKDKFHLELTGQEFRMNPGNKLGPVARGCNIEFPDQMGTTLPVHFDEPVVVSFPYVSEAFRPRVAGIIGAQVFEVAAARFDFDRSRMSLLTTQHPRIEVPPSAQRLPLITEIHNRLVSVTLNTKVIAPTTFRIDTGCRTTEIPDDLPLKTETLSERSERVNDLAGPAAVRDMLLDAITIGTAKVALPVLAVQDKAKLALLGVNILSQFLVTTDAQYGDLILEPRTHPDRRREGDTGFTSNAATGRLTIDKVYNIVAERTGIRAGDEIVSIDGNSPADVVSGRISESELQWRVNGREGAVAKVIVLRDGKELTLDVLRIGFPDTAPQVLGMNFLKLKGKAASVLEVEPGAPAVAAAMRPDDEITAVNGKSILDWPALKMTVEVLDPQGRPTVTKLQVKRATDGKTIELRVAGGKLLVEVDCLACERPLAYTACGIGCITRGLRLDGACPGIAPAA